MHHELKISPAFFEAVICEDKKFEIRNNEERGFQKGDTVLLRELNLSGGDTLYSGRQQLVTISYVSDYNQPPNQVVFAFSLTEDVTREA